LSGKFSFEKSLKINCCLIRWEWLFQQGHEISRIRRREDTVTAQKIPLSAREIPETPGISINKKAVARGGHSLKS